MKKKMICIALTICMMLTLAGCKDAIPEMSDEEMTLVTEYAAALLLKYDSNYEPMLLNDERLAEEEEMQKRVEEEAARKEAIEKEKEAQKQEQEAAEAGNAGEGMEVVSTNPAEFLGLNDVSVSFNGIEYKDAYPDGGDELYFAVQASEGCKLAVVRLKIINTGNTDNSVDIFSKNAKFRVSVNGGDYKNTMVTLLEDDFSTYAGTLAPGEAADTVLLLELKEADCISPEAVALYIKYNGDTIRTSIY